MVAAMHPAMRLLEGLRALEDLPDDAAFWADLRSIMVPRMRVLFREIFLTGAELGAEQPPAPERREWRLMGERAVLPFDFEAIAARADTAIAGYTDNWWQQFSTSTQNGLRSSIQRARASGLGADAVAKDIAPLFGEARARRIAVSETTTLMGQGAQATYEGAGFTEWEWRTVRDSRVDQVCQALDKQRFPIKQKFERAHPNCRCWPVPAGKPEPPSATTAPLTEGAGPPVPSTQPLARSGADARERIRALQPDPERVTRAEARVKEAARKSIEATEKADIAAAESEYLKAADAVADERRLALNTRDSMREVIFEGPESQATIKFGRVKPERLTDVQRKAVEDGIEAFKRMVGDTMDGKEITVRILRKQGRSYYEVGNNQLTIEMGSRSGDIARTTQTIVHELGHWMDDAGLYLDNSVQFRAGRTVGEVPQSMRQATGMRYGASETTLPDEFVNKYSGKLYRNPVSDADQATEILSMGMEQMYADPLAFATNDPAYFDWVWDIIKGRAVPLS